MQTLNLQSFGKLVRTMAIHCVVALCLLPGIVMADDWVAERLRGHVFVQIDGEWVRLERGDIVSDTSPIQSTSSGRATFTRGAEAIEIAGGTIIQILDTGTSSRPNTIVHQRSGAVTIEAEVQDVQHFRVETPFLAAVVKGTRFTVFVEEDGAEVAVQRGRVEVRDEARNQRTEVTPGQRAGNSGGRGLEVRGPGQHQQVTSIDGTTPNGNNAGGNGNGNALGLANGNSSDNANANAGNNGNGNGNSGNNGNGNGNSGNNGNGNGNSGNNGNGNGNSGNNGNGNGNSGNNGNGIGDSGNNGSGIGNSGNNGNGNENK